MEYEFGLSGHSDDGRNITTLCYGNSCTKAEYIRNKKINEHAKEILVKNDYSLLKNWMHSLVIIGSVND